MAIENGNTIKVDYKGTLADGSEFDNSEKHGQPLEFKVGEGMVIKGFDEGVLGMEVGEEKKIVIPADQAYGEPTEELIHEIPRDKLPESIADVKEGQTIGLQDPTGRQMMAFVKKMTEETVTLDMNHPLAGKELTFEVKIVEINE